MNIQTKNVVTIHLPKFEEAIFLENMGEPGNISWNVSSYFEKLGNQTHKVENEAVDRCSAGLQR